MKYEAGIYQLRVKVYHKDDSIEIFYEDVIANSHDDLVKNIESLKEVQKHRYKVTKVDVEPKYLYPY